MVYKLKLKIITSQEKAQKSTECKQWA